MLQYILRYTDILTISDERSVFAFGLYNIFQQELQVDWEFNSDAECDSERSE